MHTARRTFVATGTVAVLAAAGVTAAIAADPAPPPPPKIAFLANGINPADALAAGPIAGQLGAPLYTTQPSSLSPAAATGLDDYDPELVIVLGGPVAISDGVIDQVEDATGLAESADATPAGGIVRAAGGDRFDTAAVVADLLTAYNPAYLPINMQAIDADTLDGKHASDFLAADGKAQSAGDADTVDDIDSDQLQLPSTLPSGRTLRGVYDVTHRGGTDGQIGFFTTVVSFAVPLPDDPTPHFVEAGGTAPATCPGSPEQPEAAPGHLCVYEQLGKDYGTLDISSPITNRTGQASEYGFAIGIDASSASSLVYTRGSWAATAG